MANQMCIMIINCMDLSYKVEASFDPNSAGMTMIEHLNASVVVPANKTFNIFKDAGRANPITYIQLTDHIKNLGIQNQIKTKGLKFLQNYTLYFAIEDEARM
jgi:hypothetical protein